MLGILAGLWIGLVVFVPETVRSTQVGPVRDSRYYDREFQGINIERLVHDGAERRRLEPLIEEYLWRYGGKVPAQRYGFEFANAPIAGRPVSLEVRVMPTYIPGGEVVVWVCVPPGFRVLEGDTVVMRDIAPIDTDEIRKQTSGGREFWQELERAKASAMVRLRLRVVGEVGTHKFGVYAVGRRLSGRIEVGYEDFWVKVYEDTAYVSGTASFYRWPGSTRRGYFTEGKPPYAKEREEHVSGEQPEDSGDTSVVPGIIEPEFLEDQYPVGVGGELEYGEIRYVDGEAWVRRAGEEGFHRLEPVGCSRGEEERVYEERWYDVEVEVLDEEGRVLMREVCGVEVEGELPQRVRVRLRREEIEELRAGSVHVRLKGEHGRGN